MDVEQHLEPRKPRMFEFGIRRAIDNIFHPRCTLGNSRMLLSHLRTKPTVEKAEIRIYLAEFSELPSMDDHIFDILEHEYLHALIGETEPRLTMESHHFAIYRAMENHEQTFNRRVMLNIQKNLFAKYHGSYSYRPVMVADAKQTPRIDGYG